MHKKQNQFNPSGIKWPIEVDMPLNKTQTHIQPLVLPSKGLSGML